MEKFFADYLDRLDLMHDAALEALEGMPEEALDWSPGEGVNSMAVLITHMIGAERFWIGDIVMGEPKHRVRAEEFAVHGTTRAQLKALIEEERAYARSAVERLRLTDLAQKRTGHNSDGDAIEETAGWALLHALSHTSTHIGHIELLQDWWRARPA